MKVLITGCCGMLGKDLIQKLREKYQLAGFDVVASPAIELEYVQIDITDRSAVLKSVQSLKPDVVLHVAAYTDVDGCELNPARARSINFEGTRNLADASLAANAHLFFISTDYVFDGRKGSQYLESDAGNPLSVYGKTKWEAEEYIRRSLKNYTIVRTSWLYGANGKNFVDTILKLTETKSSLNIVSDQIGRPTYTVDLAGGLKQLIEFCEKNESAKICGTIHVANEGETSWFDFAKEIVRIAQRSVEIKPITTKELNRPALRPGYSVLSTNRFRQLAGEGLRDWKIALVDYMKYKHGMGQSR